MSAVGKQKGTVGRAIDWLVGVMSGTIPMRGLEGASAYRTTVGLVLVGLGLGGWLIWRTIQTTTAVPNSRNLANVTTPIAELEKLRNVDTDNDGLSDYAELFSLQTSPYLNDSDSDGVSDSQEVSQNTNPNCPAGQTCGSAPTASIGPDGNLPPAFLRQALKASGVPQATLDGLSDEEIVQIYGQVAATVPTQNTNSGSPSIESLESLSPEEIRSLLRAAGVDEATLSEVDDETLKEIFKQALTSE